MDGQGGQRNEVGLRAEGGRSRAIHVKGWTGVPIRGEALGTPPLDICLWPGLLRCTTLRHMGNPSVS